MLQVRQRLRRELATFELKDGFNATLERILQRRPGCLIQWHLALHDEAVLAVFYKGNDPLHHPGLMTHIVVCVFRSLLVLGPFAGRDVNVETVDRLLLASSPAKVDAPQGRGRSVPDIEQLLATFAIVGREALPPT